jgi:hypothetical protein
MKENYEGCKVVIKSSILDMLTDTMNEIIHSYSSDFYPELTQDEGIRILCHCFGIIDKFIIDKYVGKNDNIDFSIHYSKKINIEILVINGRIEIDIDLVGDFTKRIVYNKEELFKPRKTKIIRRNKKE